MYDITVYDISAYGISVYDISVYDISICDIFVYDTSVCDMCVGGGVRSVSGRRRRWSNNKNPYLGYGEKNQKNN